MEKTDFLTILLDSKPKMEYKEKVEPTTVKESGPPEEFEQLIKDFKSDNNEVSRAAFLAMLRLAKKLEP